MENHFLLSNHWSSVEQTDIDSIYGVQKSAINQKCLYDC